MRRESSLLPSLSADNSLSRDHLKRTSHIDRKKAGVGEVDGTLDPKQLDLERLLAWLKGAWADSLGNDVQVNPPSAEEEGTELIGQAVLSKKDAGEIFWFAIL